MPPINPRPSLIDVTIRSLGGLGDGIADRGGKPVFVPKTCEGDRVEVRVVHENRDGIQGLLTRVLAPGPHRATAPCPYFDACGGCTLQQLADMHYQAFKTRILHQAIAQAGYDPAGSSVAFIPARTRRRVEFKLQRNGARVRLAFHALRSHTPVPVEACLVLLPSLQALIAPLNEALSALALPQDIYAVSLTQADHGIDMILTFKHAAPTQLGVLSALTALGIARISVRTPASAPVILLQTAPVEMLLGGFAAALPPGAFLQATPHGQALLTRAALEGTQGAAHIADLFCGIGTYALPLSRAAKVAAFEGEASMTGALKATVATHGITSVTASTRDLFSQPLTSAELSRFDAVVLNPPRLGAKAQTQQIAASNLSKVVMISCNPATFARDAALLRQAGFRLTQIEGIDQFVWSSHLEIAAQFTRS